jgi:transposase
MRYSTKRKATRAKQISALVGVAPYARDSGLKIGLRSIRAPPGSTHRALPRRHERESLPSGDENLLRTTPNRRKAPELAFIAIARKPLTSINAIVRDQKPWQEAHA